MGLEGGCKLIMMMIFSAMCFYGIALMGAFSKFDLRCSKSFMRVILMGRRSITRRDCCGDNREEKMT